MLSLAICPPEAADALNAELGRLSRTWQRIAVGRDRASKDLALAWPLPWFELDAPNDWSLLEASSATRWQSVVLADSRPSGILTVAELPGKGYGLESLRLGTRGSMVLDALDRLESRAAGQSATPNWVVAGFDDARLPASGLMVLPLGGSSRQAVIVTCLDAPPSLSPFEFVERADYELLVGSWLARPG